jgi:leucyl aminopeptidase
MKNKKIVITNRPIEKYSGSLLVFLASKRKKQAPLCDHAVEKKVADLFKLDDFTGKEEETIIFYPKETQNYRNFKAQRILIIGVGELTKNLSSPAIKENLRRVGGTVAKCAEKAHAEDILLVLPGFLDTISCYGAEQLIEGILLGDYRFTKYKTKQEDKEKFSGIKKLSIQADKMHSSIRKAAQRAQNAAAAAVSARNMAHEPGNCWTPQDFADFAQELARQTSLKCRIIDKAQIKKLGMGGILAVNQGSSIPPKLIILEHRPKHFSHTFLFVGKGLTFDSGGISLKPAAGMQDMKYDMCGGAAVLSTMKAIGLEKPGVRVIAIVPATDNMSGAAAVKPGDIIKHFNGITSEVINTDAEGRLILADALAYGIKKYSPDCVIDLATLTGAVIIGLGHHRSGLMGNNDKLAKKIIEIGEECGEPVWQLPLGKDYSKQIESDVADIKNVGGKAAGSITAAAYLENFVGDTPWAHLDIAGTAWNFTEKSYIPKGPSGVGVRTLIAFVRSWKTLQL